MITRGLILNRLWIPQPFHPDSTTSLMESGEGTSTSADTVRIFHYHPPPYHTVEHSDHTSDPSNNSRSSNQNDTDPTPSNADASPPTSLQQVLCSSTASASTSTNVLVLSMPSPPSSPGSTAVMHHPHHPNRPCPRASLPVSSSRRRLLGCRAMSPNNNSTSHFATLHRSGGCLGPCAFSSLARAQGI